MFSTTASNHDCADGPEARLATTTIQNDCVQCHLACGHKLVVDEAGTRGHWQNFNARADVRMRADARRCAASNSDLLVEGCRQSCQSARGTRLHPTVLRTGTDHKSEWVGGT